MRSLPPPRVTTKRRWKRFKRALKSLVFTGNISDPGAFVWKKKLKPTKVKAKRRAWLSRNPNESKVEKTTNIVGRLVARAALPLINKISKRDGLVNMSVRF